MCDVCYLEMHAKSNFFLDLPFYLRKYSIYYYKKLFFYIDGEPIHFQNSHLKTGLVLMVIVFTLIVQYIDFISYIPW